VRQKIDLASREAILLEEKSDWSLRAEREVLEGVDRRATQGSYVEAVEENRR
jgi:hypothetical protein